jgi:hypothetical protein
MIRGMKPIQYHPHTLRRLYAIGDPHGCLTELQAIIQKIHDDGFDPAQDQILVVGDLVDRGPESLKCLQFVRDTPGVISVLGNHEDAYLRLWRHEQRKINDPNYEVPMKLAPYKQANYNHFMGTDPGIFNWLDEVPTIRVFQVEGRTRSIVGVHAGLNPVIPTLERQELPKCRHIRFFSKEKNKPVSQDLDSYDAQPANSVFWYELYKGQQDVVFGHHSFEKVMKHSSGYGTCFGIDTGCCWGMNLSAVRFDAEGETTLATPALENYSTRYRKLKADAAVEVPSFAR